MSDLDGKAGHLAFNTMTTTDAVYCNETGTWITYLIRKSIPISGVSEKHRYQFFKKTYRQIDKLIEKIKS